MDHLRCQWLSPGQRTPQRLARVTLFTLVCAATLLLTGPAFAADANGISDKIIRLGTLLPLEGDRKDTGNALKAGLEAAFNSQTVQGRHIELAAINDFYDPTKTPDGAKKLIEQGVFMMIGNHGTPTVKAVLPLLAEKQMPLFGPYTGAGLTGPGDVLNVRTSYLKEVKSVIDIALSAGLKPTEVCGYLQNDSYGMSGLQGIRTALADQPNTASLIAKLDEIMNQSGDHPSRNNIGPIGVYQRDTLSSQEGYQSLKNWEKANNTSCRLVVTVGVFNALAKFVAFARYKNEPWVFSFVSFTGVPLNARFNELQMTGKLIQTAVTPPLDSSLPLVDEARKALGAGLNPASLEAYMVGKLFLAIAAAADTPLTREGFLKAARRQTYDIGGLKIDWTNNRPSGFDGVFLAFLKDDKAFVPAKPGDIEGLFKR
jgi:ABC-type branched-subunit amino acid transport system substrate-binding protein